MPEITSLDEVEGAPHATLFDADPRVVRLRLSAGERVPPHRHPESTVLLFVSAGRLSVDLDDETYSVGAGDVVRFDGRREVSPTAVEESTALVVFVPRSDRVEREEREEREEHQERQERQGRQGRQAGGDDGS